MIKGKSILKSKTDNTISVIRCKDWYEFKNNISDISIRIKENLHMSGDIIYRGHSNINWKIRSSLERDFYKRFRGKIAVNQTREQYECLINHYLNDIRTLAKGNRVILSLIDDTDDDLDWWFLGRHYGLPSPYLDWSRSPYVAAFFAFQEAFSFVKKSQSIRYYEKNPDNKVCIWGLADAGIRSKNTGKDFDLIEARFSSNARQRAQQSVFTLLFTAKGEDYLAYFKAKNLLNRFVKYEIPYSEAFCALYDLELMGINYLTLFPDIEGFFKYANIEISAFKKAFK